MSKHTRATMEVAEEISNHVWDQISAVFPGTGDSGARARLAAECIVIIDRRFAALVEAASKEHDLCDLGAEGVGLCDMCDALRAVKGD